MATAFSLAIMLNDRRLLARHHSFSPTSEPAAHEILIRNLLRSTLSAAPRSRPAGPLWGEVRVLPCTPRPSTTARTTRASAQDACRSFCRPTIQPGICDTQHDIFIQVRWTVYFSGKRVCNAHQHRPTESVICFVEIRFAPAARLSTNISFTHATYKRPYWRLVCFNTESSYRKF